MLPNLDIFPDILEYVLKYESILPHIGTMYNRLRQNYQIIMFTDIG